MRIVSERVMNEDSHERVMNEVSERVMNEDMRDMNEDSE